MASKKVSINREIQAGSNVSVYIRKDTSAQLLKWLNSQKDVGPAIVDALEKHVKGEYITIDRLRSMLEISNGQDITSLNQPVGLDKEIALSEPEWEEEKQEKEEEIKEVTREVKKEKINPDEIIIEDEYPLDKQNRNNNMTGKKMPPISPSWDTNK